MELINVASFFQGESFYNPYNSSSEVLEELNNKGLIKENEGA